MSALVRTVQVASADGSSTRLPEPLFAALASCTVQAYYARCFADVSHRTGFNRFAEDAWEMWRSLLD